MSRARPKDRELVTINGSTFIYQKPLFEAGRWRLWGGQRFLGDDDWPMFTGSTYLHPLQQAIVQARWEGENR